MDKNKIITTQANRLGLTEVGFVRLPLPEALAATLHAAGEPSPFTPPDVTMRLDPSALLPGAQSVIVCLFPYRPASATAENAAEPPANLPEYARARDYHIIVQHYLTRLQARLQAHFPDADFFPFVDTSPLPDRALAYLAGLGFFGWNKALINDRYGTHTMIGGLVTTLALAPSEPLQKTCLQCGRCRRFCPGQALTPERFIWQRCKSYITQKKGDLTAAEAAIVTKNHYIFGCDVCQEVCPHNTAAEPTPLPEFQNDRITRITAEEISRYSNRTFQAAYGDRAWAWRGKKILLRNAALLAESSAHRNDDNH